MAVSLVSTGIQFPDSTIQTTAATAGSMTLISTTTTTSGNSISYTNLSSSYRYYILDFTNVKNSFVPTGGGGSETLSVRLSNNNGSSYATTGYLYLADPGSTSGGGTDAFYTLSTNGRTGSTASGRYYIYNPSVANTPGMIQMQAMVVTSAPPGYGNSSINNQYFGGSMVSAGTTGLSAVNAIQLYWENARTFTSGTWKLYGVS